MTDGQRSITENGKIARVRIADFVVGCHVEQEPGRIRLHHKLLATKLINHFRVQDCNPIYTTFASGTEVKKSDCCTEEDLKESYISKYKSGVATVLYLACTTRPELAKFASELGKVQHRPGRKHFAFLKHVVKYIATHDEDGIVFAAPKEPTEKPAELIGYADASWADQRDDRRSTGGYVCFFNGGPISWLSKILRAVALSSAESELYAACLATQDVVHLRRVLEDMTGVAPSGPTTIYEDNNAVIFMTADKAKTISTKTKHIACRWFYTASKVKDGTVVLKPIPTTEQLADIFTKVTIPRVQYEFLRGHLVTEVPI